MPIFKYKAKDNKGKVISGTMDAENRSSVVNRLQTMDLFPVSIQDETAEKKKQQGFKFSSKPRLADINSFIRQLSDMIGAGISLVKALNTIGDQMPNENLREIIKVVAGDVQGGDTFAVAISKHPTVFSKLFVAMVRAGEAGGMLDDVLMRLADYSEAELELKGKIKSSLAYPVVMICASSIAIAVIMTFVIPKIVIIFKDLNQTLPLPTIVLIKISAFFTSFWWIVLIALGAVIFLTMKFIKTSKGKFLFDTMLLKIPMLGTIILKQEISRFSRTFGSLLRNGVSILKALEITEEVLTNDIVSQEVKMLPAHITQGEGVAKPLRNNPIFPVIVVNMIAVGEETGKLDEVLLKIAKSYEGQVERDIKTFTSLLEPMIILIMGIVVGFIVISILLPIFSIDPGA